MADVVDQAALNASWAQARRDMADPEFRARLEAVIEKRNRPQLAREEFLAQTQPPEEKVASLHRLWLRCRRWRRGRVA